MSHTSSIRSSLRPEPGEDLPRHGRPFLLLVPGGAALVLPLGLLDADVVEVGGRQDHGQVPAFLPADLLRIPGHAACVADAFEVVPEIALHLHGHPVLEEVLLLADQLGREVSDTLLGILAVGGTPEVHAGIQEPVPALGSSVSWCRP